MMEKTELLFRMMDNPKQYTNEQWREILADDECASLYEMMCKTKSALDAERVNHELDDKLVDEEWERFSAVHKSSLGKALDWRKIAAAVVVLSLFGIATAAIYSHVFNKPKTEIVHNPITKRFQQSSTQDVNVADTEAEKHQSRLYDDVPLEQIMDDVATIYNVDVEWRSDEARDLRLYYQWEPSFTLDKVVDMLNSFEAINITREGDKIIINQAE